MSEYVSRVAIMVGLPCSGKSTLAKQLTVSPLHTVVVCPDTIRLALHGQQFIPEAEPMVWAIAQVMVNTLLEQGYAVIIDATNTTRERRRMWTQLSRKWGPVTIHWVRASVDECKRRNAELRRLNPAIIDRMMAQFETPSDTEGIIIEHYAQ
jgi:predicted kinase